MGQQGDDILYGEDGDDILIGGSNVAGALDGDDVIDGGTGNDLIAGDNAECCFRNDLLDPRMRALSGTRIYGTTLRHGNDGVALVTGTVAERPDRHPPVPDHAARPQRRHPGEPARALGRRLHRRRRRRRRDLRRARQRRDPGRRRTSTASCCRSPLRRHVVDDGFTRRPAPAAGVHGRPARPAHAHRRLARRPERARRRDARRPPVASRRRPRDGDDYIEGNGGDDTIFGGLGQDDIVGDSSDLYISGLVGQLVTIDGQCPALWRIIGVSADGSVADARRAALLAAEQQTGRTRGRSRSARSPATTGLVTIAPITLARRRRSRSPDAAGFDWHTVGYCLGADVQARRRRPDLRRRRHRRSRATTRARRRSRADGTIIDERRRATRATPTRSPATTREIFRIVGTNGVAVRRRTRTSRSLYDNYAGGAADHPARRPAPRLHARAARRTKPALGRDRPRRRRRDPRRGRRRLRLRHEGQRRPLRRGPGRRPDRRLRRRLDLRRHRRRRRPRRRRPHLDEPQQLDRLDVRQRRPPCNGERHGTCFSEPLYGIARAARRPTRTRATANGNVLNEFIYTPGHVQDGDDQRRRRAQQVGQPDAVQRRPARARPALPAGRRLRRHHLRRPRQRLPPRRLGRRRDVRRRGAAASYVQVYAGTCLQDSRSTTA